MIKFECPSCSARLKFNGIVNEFECQSCGSKLTSNRGLVQLQAYIVFYLTLPISYVLAENILQYVNVLRYSTLGWLLPLLVQLYAIHTFF
ncbi:hypothetical protein Kkor_2405 [Kangiella koreensis DSM 16069]|uniref:Uncharacterized protein n=1 Tax=Kangiella koreensis (strain DSM 16069 / JCM 12317 / KCTC 12182 / SW-125) TaxID=523791 RepID=C7R924_KANKD|nr:hypothetical protein Kkor_2405 [Kangiella koreensis DSM 16069]